MTVSSEVRLPAGRTVEIVQQKFLAYAAEGEGVRTLQGDEITAFERYLDAPVDPTEEQLLVASMGPQKTGGYFVEFAHIIETDEALWVEVIQIGPDSECNVTMAATGPMQLAVIARSDKPVRFVVRPLERRACN